MTLQQWWQIFLHFLSTAMASPPLIPILLFHSPPPFISNGDKMALESYWWKMRDKCTVEIKGWEFLSYGRDRSSGVCWFMTPELRDAIKRLHGLVGNAETDNSYLVIGNGATQLFQAALFAPSSSPSLSPHNPINVVAAAPHYLGYPDETDMVRSSLYKWSGDAREYDKNGAYIEIVNYPNNPDCNIRTTPVVNNKYGCEGELIHDLVFTGLTILQLLTRPNITLCSSLSPNALVTLALALGGLL